MKRVITEIIIALLISIQFIKSDGNVTGIVTDCILGEEWTDGCNNFTCTVNGPLVVNKDKIFGCKASKCYKPGHRLQLDLCSVVECGPNKKFKVVKLGCLDGNECKSKGQKWPVSKDGECKTMKCVANFRKRKYSSKSVESKISQYCKEMFSDKCHQRKAVWYEYFPGKGVKSSGTCKKVRCTRKGPKPSKKSKACTHEEKCIMNGKTVSRMSPDQPVCRCQDGRMICVNTTP